jgi:DNA repair protein SbcD/Mre11
MKKLRVLHTSDLHLGQKLINYGRETEQELALNWLIKVIERERVEVLLISGDIFDTKNPSIAAETLYYQFLAKLIPTCCRHVVITAGNHDSPSKLNAPKALMDALKLHVVSQIGENPGDEVLVFDDADGKPELIVAAIPFLVPEHLKIKDIGVSVDDRRAGIRNAVRSHFHAVGEEAAKLNYPGAVHICMGHLCVGGQDITEDQTPIYGSDTQILAPTDFHEVFDYVALGHIHRAQKLDKIGRVRYSGSLIPLSFSELKQKKIVYIIDFEDGRLAQVRDVEVPIMRRLVQITTNYDQLSEALSAQASVDVAYPTWADVIVQSKENIPLLAKTIADLTLHLNIDVLKSQIVLDEANRPRPLQLEQINQLKPSDLFVRKCKKDGYTEEQIESMLPDFHELKAWMESKQDQ